MGGCSSSWSHFSKDQPWACLSSPWLCRNRCLQRMVQDPCFQVKLLFLIPVNIQIPEFQSFLQNTCIKNFWIFSCLCWFILVWFCLFSVLVWFWGIFFCKSKFRKYFWEECPRKISKPLILHIQDFNVLKKFIAEHPPYLCEKIKQFWARHSKHFLKGESHVFYKLLWYSINHWETGTEESWCFLEI